MILSDLITFIESSTIDYESFAPDFKKYKSWVEKHKSQIEASGESYESLYFTRKFCKLCLEQFGNLEQQQKEVIFLRLQTTFATIIKAINPAAEIPCQTATAETLQHQNLEAEELLKAMKEYLESKKISQKPKAPEQPKSSQASMLSSLSVTPVPSAMTSISVPVSSTQKQQERHETKESTDNDDTRSRAPSNRNSVAPSLAMTSRTTATRVFQNRTVHAQQTCTAAEIASLKTMLGQQFSLLSECKNLLGNIHNYRFKPEVKESINKVIYFLITGLGHVANLSELLQECQSKMPEEGKKFLEGINKKASAINDLTSKGASLQMLAKYIQIPLKDLNSTQDEFKASTGLSK